MQGVYGAGEGGDAAHHRLQHEAGMMARRGVFAARPPCAGVESVSPPSRQLSPMPSFPMPSNSALSTSALLNPAPSNCAPSNCAPSRRLPPCDLLLRVHARVLALRHVVVQRFAPCLASHFRRSLAMMLPLCLAACAGTVPPPTPSASHAGIPLAGERGDGGRVRPRPIVIAHRGASGYRPEHTLEAYALAIQQGADFIEPDLVATRDGVLIARHENELSDTTDVADHPEFAGRRTTKRIDGERKTGWFSEDFTLAEIKTLRARERIPQLRPRNTDYDGQFEIPTLQEILALLEREAHAGRAVGIYPETKHPTWFAREGTRIDGSPIGISLGQTLVDTLVAHGFTDASRVHIQSFEVENLLELRHTIMPRAGVDFPLVQLLGHPERDAPHDIALHAADGDDLQAIYAGLAGVTVKGLGMQTRYRDLATPAGLGWMQVHYASGIGPPKQLVLAGRGQASTLVADAHAAGLRVHPYTSRAESRFLLPGFDDVQAETDALFALGVVGVFIDHPDIGVAARARAESMPETTPAR